MDPRILTTLEDFREDLHDSTEHFYSYQPISKHARLWALQETLGLEILGHGIHRVVFALSSDAVLKVAYNSNGFAANIGEQAAFSGFPNVPKARVLEGDPFGLWLSQERVQLLNKYRPSVLSGFLKQIGDPQNRCRLDLHYRNLGLRPDGSVVILDYSSLVFPVGSAIERSVLR